MDEETRLRVTISMMGLCLLLGMVGLLGSSWQVEGDETRASLRTLYMDVGGGCQLIVEQTEMGDEGLPVKLAGEVMVSPLVTVSLEESLESARKKMGSDGEITQLPVIVNGECVGLVTSNSILNKPPGAKLVKQVIESIPPIIAENMKVTEQVKALVTNSPCVLVSEKNSSKIKGIIVAWDLISTKGYNTWKKDKNWKKNGKYIFYRDITRSRIVKEVSRK